jgi:ubiquinol-cytochrome c reductase iron-sulfur subunit
VATAPSDPVGPQDGPETKRDFIHILAGVAALGAVGGLAWPLIDQMNPAGDTLALASIEVDYSKVVLGQQIVVKWRGGPVFIRHRTPKEIAEAVADDYADLRDPATDESRHKPGMAEWLIVIGICTHLGCVPTFGQGEYGCAPATARSTTLPDESGRAPHPRTSTFQTTPFYRVPRSRSVDLTGVRTRRPVAYFLEDQPPGPEGAILEREVRADGRSSAAVNGAGRRPASFTGKLRDQQCIFPCTVRWQMIRAEAHLTPE